MAVVADKLSRKMSEEEFMRLPHDGRKWELVNGEAREVPTNVEHDAIIVNLVVMMGPCAKGHGFMTVGQESFRMSDDNSVALMCPILAGNESQVVSRQELSASWPPICVLKSSHPRKTVPT